MTGLLIPEGPAIGDVLLATFLPEGPSSEELSAALFELLARKRGTKDISYV